MPPEQEEATIDVSVVVVSYNTCDLLSSCLASVPASERIELIVVDNDSSDGSRAMVRAQYPRARLIENQTNVGFVVAANQGIQASRGRYVLLLNSDAVLIGDALATMLEFADMSPRAAIVGARIENPDGTFQASHARFPTLSVELLILTGLGRWIYGPWYPSHGPDDFRAPAAVDYVCGACLLARRAAIDEVGLLDQSYFMYSEEVDWCYEMKRAGWQVWYQPHAAVSHQAAGSSSSDAEREALLYRGRVRFFRKHYGNGPARRLKLTILVLTSLKSVVHAVLRTVTGGRRGRQVVRLSALLAILRGV